MSFSHLSCRSTTYGSASGRGGGDSFGKFRQRSRIVGSDEQHVIATAEVQFELKEIESHATNVHYFSGVQFQQFGLHHVESTLWDRELRLRFPLPVVRISPQQ